MILAYQHIVTGSSLIPAVAISAKQDGGARCVVEQILFYGRPLGCAEQASSGSVVANDIVCKADFRCPGQVFYADGLLRRECGRQRTVECDAEFFCPFHLSLSFRLNACNDVSRIHRFHRARTDELDGVSFIAPIETVGLSVHIGGNQRGVIEALLRFQVSAVYIDGVVHHVFIKPVLRDNRPFALREVSGIGLGCEVARVVRTF